MHATTPTARGVPVDAGFPWGVSCGGEAMKFQLGFHHRGNQGSAVLQLAAIPLNHEPFTLSIAWKRRGKTSLIKRRLSYRWPVIRYRRWGVLLDRVTVKEALRCVALTLLNRSTRRVG